jgi:hypothetical protein
MIEPCQDLAFRSEAAQDLSRVGASIQYLDRDLFLKLTISPLRQKNCAHPAAAKFTDDNVRAHALSAARRSFLPESGGCVLDAIFEAIRTLLKKRLRFGQERLGLFEQICILTAAPFHQGNPSCRRVLFQRFAQDGFQAIPALRVDVPLPEFDSFCGHGEFESLIRR